MVSTASATVATLTVTSKATIAGDLTADTATMQDSFKVLGTSYLGDTTIAGTMNLGEHFTIGQNAINVTGTPVATGETPTDGILYIQNAPLANLVNIFNGAVTIDRNGTIQTQGDINIGGNLNIEGAITISGIAGEDIQAGDALYVYSNKTVKKADATDPIRVDIVGIAANDAALGQPVKIIIGGKAKGFKNLHAGQQYFLGADATITTVVPVTAIKIVPVGIAFSDSELIIRLTPATVSDASSATN